MKMLRAAKVWGVRFFVFAVVFSFVVFPYATNALTVNGQAVKDNSAVLKAPSANAKTSSKTPRVNLNTVIESGNGLIKVNDSVKASDNSEMCRPQYEYLKNSDYLTNIKQHNLDIFYGKGYCNKVLAYYDVVKDQEKNAAMIKSSNVGDMSMSKTSETISVGGVDFTRDTMGEAAPSIGTSYVNYPSDVIWIRDIEVLSPEFIVLSGKGANNKPVLYIDRGEGFVKENIPGFETMGTAVLTRVFSPTDIWTASQGGVFHYDGQSWTKLYYEYAQNTYDIIKVSDRNCYYIFGMELIVKYENGVVTRLVDGGGNNYAFYYSVLASDGTIYSYSPEPKIYSFNINQPFNLETIYDGEGGQFEQEELSGLVINTAEDKLLLLSDQTTNYDAYGRVFNLETNDFTESRHAAFSLATFYPNNPWTVNHWTDLEVSRDYPDLAFAVGMHTIALSIDRNNFNMQEFQVDANDDGRFSTEDPDSVNDGDACNYEAVSALGNKQGEVYVVANLSGSRGLKIVQVGDRPAPRITINSEPVYHGGDTMNVTATIDALEQTAVVDFYLALYIPDMDEYYFWPTFTSDISSLDDIGSHTVVIPKSGKAEFDIITAELPENLTHLDAQWIALMTGTGTTAVVGDVVVEGFSLEP